MAEENKDLAQAEVAKVPHAVIDILRWTLGRLQGVELALAGVERARGNGHILVLEAREQQPVVDAAHTKLKEFYQRAPGNGVNPDLVVKALGGVPDLGRFGIRPFGVTMKKIVIESGMSECSGIIRDQVLALCVLKPAVVRHRTSTLEVYLRGHDEDTLLVGNLAEKDGDEGLCMNVSIRLNRGDDSYDAMVCHLYREEGNLDVLRRYELIDGIGVEQLPDLLSGEYNGDPRNAISNEAAEAWLSGKKPAPGKGLSI